MRDQTAGFAPIGTGHLLSRSRGDMGNVDRVHRRAVADHVDQRGDDDGSRVSAALALRTRYRGQALIAAGGAIGAASLVVLWAIQSGIGG